MIESRPIRVLLADESELLRRGVRQVLSAENSPPIHVVGEAATVAEAVRHCDAFTPDLLVTDVRLPDGSGAELCRRAMRRLPGLRAIVLTSHTNDNFVFEAIAAGVHGYLLKNVSPADLVRGLRDVAAGRSILDPDATARVVRMLRRGAAAPGPLAMLSQQERRVLALVAEGLTNKQVAQQLALSGNTVKNYLISVFEKLKVKRRAHAATIYVQAANPQ